MTSRHTHAVIASTVQGWVLPHLIACVESRNVKAAPIRRLFGRMRLDDPNIRVPEAMTETAWRLAADLTGDEALGIHVAESLPRGTLDLIEYALRSSPSLEKGLDRLARYGRLLSDRVAARTQREGKSLLLLVHDTAMTPLQSARAEFSLAAVVKLARDSTGTWYWLKSSVGFSQYGSVQWGDPKAGDVPLTADVDSDGLADIVVFRRLTGQWFWLTSSSGYSDKFYDGTTLGDSSDLPMLADMDGDGKADPIVYDPSNGTWYWRKSSSFRSDYGTVQLGAFSQGEVPLTADFDGDGRADVAVWSEGTWHWLTSGTEYSGGASKVWGDARFDVPVVK